MTREELREAVVQALKGVAPEIDAASIQSSVTFRDQLDLDSMDFLNFVLALHHRLSIDIPEVDYPKLMTLDDAIAYLGTRAVPPATLHSSGQP